MSHTLNRVNKEILLFLSPEVYDGSGPLSLRSLALYAITLWKEPFEIYSET